MRPALLKRHSGSGVHHEAQAVGAAWVNEVFVAAPKFDAVQVLDAAVYLGSRSGPGR